MLGCITDGVGMVNMAWIMFFFACFALQMVEMQMALSLLHVIILYSVGNSVSPLFL